MLPSTDNGLRPRGDAMIRIGILEYFRNLKRNICLSAVFSCLALVVVSLVSLYQQEREALEPFRIICENTDYMLPDLNGGVDLDSDEIDSVCRMYRTVMDTTAGKITGYIYEAWIYDNWAPRLAEGKWISEADTEEVSVVIGGLTDGFSAGDELTLGNGLNCRITGILQKDTEIIWKESGFYDSTLHENYSGYFGVPEVTGKSGIYCILSMEDASKAGVSITPEGGWCFLGFREGLGEEEKEELAAGLFESNGAVGLTTGEFMSASENQFAKKTLGLRGISLIGFFLALILNAAASFVTIRESLRIYGIYRILGACRFQCGCIFYCNIIGIAAAALVFYKAEEAALVFSAEQGKLIFTAGSGTPVLMGMLLLFMLIPVIGLVICFRGKYPLRMLREEMS